MKIKVSSRRPDKEGRYIFVGKYLKEPEIIHVVKYPASEDFGIYLPSYLGVANHARRGVHNLDGYFSEKLDDEIEISQYP